VHRLTSCVAALLALAAPAFAQSTWEIDPGHSSIQFSVRHLMISNVRGQFGSFKGGAKVDDKNLAGTVVEATIDAASIDTREPKRDAHLKTADFLDVGRFPTITFKSKQIAPAGEGRWKMTGDLTLHGVTREVVLDVEGPTPYVKDMRGDTRAGLSATTKLKRKDFGIVWNKAMDGGGVVVGDDIDVAIEVEGVRRDGAAGG
jgi:polyisoprenoid-binding protein YceI